MGLMGWLAGRYYVKEARRIAADARSLPLPSRNNVVFNLAQQMKRTIDREPLGISAVVLEVQDVFQDATRARQMAVANGATGRTDPTWCGAALVETWAGARLAAITGRISLDKFSRVDAVMFDLIAETLEPDQLAMVVDPRCS